MFWGFPRLDELLIFCLEIRIESDGDQGRHVKPSPDLLAAASDEGLSFPIAGLPGDGGEARQGCDLLFIEAAELWHLNEEHGGADLGDAWDGAQNSEALGQIRIALDLSLIHI